MMPYNLSKQAEKDLEDILIHGILKFGDVQALKYQASFKNIFELLAYMPTLGRKSERSIKQERRFLHGSHVIYYNIEEKSILIKNILYGPLIKDIWNE